MKHVTIPGSKYILSLEDEENQWWIRLRINQAVEEEIPLTHLEEKTLGNNIKELLTNAHLTLTEIQIEMLQKEVWQFIQSKLDADKQSRKRQFGTIEDPRYEGVLSRLDTLANEIDDLEAKISEKEKLLT